MVSEKAIDILRERPWATPEQAVELNDAMLEAEAAGLGGWTPRAVACGGRTLHQPTVGAADWLARMRELGLWRESDWRGGVLALAYACANARRPESLPDSLADARAALRAFRRAVSATWEELDAALCRVLPPPGEGGPEPGQPARWSAWDSVAAAAGRGISAADALRLTPAELRRAVESAEAAAGGRLPPAKAAAAGRVARAVAAIGESPPPGA